MYTYHFKPQRMILNGQAVGRLTVQCVMCTQINIYFIIFPYVFGEGTISLIFLRFSQIYFGHEYLNLDSIPGSNFSEASVF